MIQMWEKENIDYIDYIGCNYLQVTGRGNQDKVTLQRFDMNIKQGWNGVVDKLDTYSSLLDSCTHVYSGNFCKINTIQYKL